MTKLKRPFSARIYCPSSHPYAYDKGKKCTSNMFKNITDHPGSFAHILKIDSFYDMTSLHAYSILDCDGNLLDIYSSCYSDNSVDCSSLPGQLCKSHPTGKIRILHIIGFRMQAETHRAHGEEKKK